MKELFHILSGVAAAILIGLVIFVLIQYQFEIYKKKHGEQMTFTDFLFDAEKK